MANMGPTWVLLAPDGPHVGPMNLAIRVYMSSSLYPWNPHPTAVMQDYLLTFTKGAADIKHYKPFQRAMRLGCTLFLGWLGQKCRTKRIHCYMSNWSPRKRKQNFIFVAFPVDCCLKNTNIKCIRQNVISLQSTVTESQDMSSMYCTTTGYSKFACRLLPQYTEVYSWSGNPPGYHVKGERLKQYSDYTWRPFFPYGMFAITILNATYFSLSP